jgi:hypothetical protein
MMAAPGGLVGTCVRLFDARKARTTGDAKGRIEGVKA